jgi:hypothetical protein
MMQIRIAPALFCASLALAVVSIANGCKKDEPAPASAPAPAPAATTDQSQGATNTGAQAPAVPDAAEPAGSQVQFK